MAEHETTTGGRPTVMIVGGGFAGLAVAKGLRGVDAEVALLDRRNHHVFQPLLYQVATASLSPASISAPIRSALKKAKHCQVVLADVIGIDTERQRVLVEEGSAPYDYLVLGVGVRHDYFGNDHWEPLAPGLKTLEDATEIRRRMLLAFESAEHEADEEARRAALTFAVVGGGPTGVELAGAIKSIASRTLPREFRNIDTTTARVILLQGGDRVLEGFPEALSARAQKDLADLGVEVRLESRVTSVDADGVRVGDEYIPATNVFWAAGVRGSPLLRSLGTPLDRAGRAIVEPDLSIPGYPNVFVLGDASCFRPEGADHSLPGVAQVAMQMGKHAARIIKDEIDAGGPAGSSPLRKTAFRYRDKGSMAIIGKNRAVASIGGYRFAGFFAWLMWAVVHIAFLVGFRNRARVLFSWVAGWLLNSHDARLIIGKSRLRVLAPRGPGFELNERRDDSAPVRDGVPPVLAADGPRP
ncbi:MAG: NAD(P)/FAD-dependent oxidoreductase [Planctomycetota bacterium]